MKLTELTALLLFAVILPLHAQTVIQFNDVASDGNVEFSQTGESITLKNIHPVKDDITVLAVQLNQKVR